MTLDMTRGKPLLLLIRYALPLMLSALLQQCYPLADGIIARHQEQLSFDELFIGEDICYNHGPLISPDMMKEFRTTVFPSAVGAKRASSSLMVL